ncbi:SPFH/Band 7/PHB domain protein [bacterium]|nr:SPFH/Band 7/PHB domain protein [bacterium]
MLFFLLALLALVVAYFVSAFKIIRQAEVMVIERLGKFHCTLRAGAHLIVPIIDVPRGIILKEQVRGMGGVPYTVMVEKTRIDLREQVYDFPRQNVITKDNVSIGINALIYFQITKPESAVYEIQHLTDAIEKLTQTTLRNIIGEMDLDETLVSRDIINNKLRVILDEASNKWGVKVNRVELQDIMPPSDIQSSMEKQMKAERERRAVILEAEGQKRSAILKAEGQRESAIANAEGEQQSAILKAQGLAKARILQAEAEAEAIRRTVAAIEGHGDPDKYLIAVRYLDTLKKMVEGNENKVVYMPYEATGILSSVDGIKQMFSAEK